VILGCLSALEEAEIRLECARWAAGAALSCPARARSTCRRSARTRCSRRCIRISSAPPPTRSASAAARCTSRSFPYGPDGARAFYETLAAAFGKTVSYARTRARSVGGAANAKSRRCAAARSPSAPTRCSNCRSRARCARPARASVRRHAERLQEIPRRRTARSTGVEMLERPDRFALFARFRALAPDLVVANLNIANAARGHGLQREVVDRTDVPADPRLQRRARRSSACSPRRPRRHDALAARRARATARRAPDRSRLLPRAAGEGAREARVWSYQAPAHVGVSKARRRSVSPLRRARAQGRRLRHDHARDVRAARRHAAALDLALSEATLAGAPPTCRMLLRESTRASIPR
jgi:hypothetical protein